MLKTKPQNDQANSKYRNCTPKQSPTIFKITQQTPALSNVRSVV